MKLPALCSPARRESFARFQSVDETLERKRGGDLFRYLLERFASFSGISGVQPKNPRPRLNQHNSTKANPMSHEFWNEVE